MVRLVGVACLPRRFLGIDFQTNCQITCFYMNFKFTYLDFKKHWKFLNNLTYLQKYVDLLKIKKTWTSISKKIHFNSDP